MYSRLYEKIIVFSMVIQALGELPKDMVLKRNGKIFLFGEDRPQPLFSVDAALFFSGADAGAKELLKRSGRPFIDFSDGTFTPDLLYTEYLDYLKSLPHTNYQPIDCNFYDNFEAAIVQRRTVDLVYLAANGSPISATTRLKDLKTHRIEEFVQLASGEWLRLDRIVSVGGVEAGSSCRF